MAERSRSGLLASRIASSSKRMRHNTSPTRRLCPHCQQSLSLKTYNKHRKLFLKGDGSWVSRKDQNLESNSENEDEADDQIPTMPTFNNPDLVQTADNNDSKEESESESSEDSDISEEEIWENGEDVEDQSADVSPIPDLPVFNTASSEHVKAISLLKWLIIFLLSLQSKFHISDSGIDMLLSFLRLFVSIVGQFSTFVAVMAELFPKSRLMAQKFLGIETSFKKFVICPKCFKCYLFKDCWCQLGSNQITKYCDFVRYPMHPHTSRRVRCNAPLLKSIEFCSGRKLLYPHKIYCYKSLISSLQGLLLSAEFVQECNHWLNKTSSSFIRDLYDGNVWRRFLYCSGTPFLSAPFTYGLVLNIDWFQPYSHTVASVGVIYLAVMNLPRHLRYKRKNMLLVGIIPGPSEPKEINSFLFPLVEELKQFWHGVTLAVKTESGRQEQALVRCALLCVACDVPAGRKVCGFLSHSAAKGCSKCYKTFSGGVSSMCYAGFDRSLWTPRTNTMHRENVAEILKCNTMTERVKMETQFGCRYSALLELPYFDPPTMLTIDSMHNLFLGTGKHMIHLWLNSGILNSKKYQQIQQCVDNFSVPSDVGRIPRKIETGFSGFKADQFKTWILLYSIPALFGILPNEHLECWRYYVLACRILCRQKLTHSEINLADALLLKFCKKVEILYGIDAVTPNMHLHCHLKDVILDYGPVQEFWLFSFERYNGILGQQPTNNRSVEPQLMERFLRENDVHSVFCPDDFRDVFLPVLENVNFNRSVGSVLDTVSCIDSGFIAPMKCSRNVLTSSEIDILKELVLKTTHISYMVNTVYYKYTSFTINGKCYRSSGNPTKHPAVALALWDEELYGPAAQVPCSSLIPSISPLRPVHIFYFIKILLTHGETNHSVYFAHVSWFSPHPDCHAIGKPVELWCASLFSPFGLASFLPISNINGRCAHSYRDWNNERVLLCVPLIT